MPEPDDPAVTAIVDAAKATTSGSSAQGGDLRGAVEQASPDQRGAAAKQLADDGPAREALHATLRELGIEQGL